MSRHAVRDVTERFVYPDDRVIEKPFDWGQTKRLLGYLKPYTKNVVIVLLITMIGTASSLAVPMVIRYAIDFGITNHDARSLTLSVAFLAGCYFVWWLATGIRIQ